MFDIGFWEIMFIMVVALLVVGPERLPRLARTAGLWLGKIRGFVSTVKADIDREIAADELKKVMQKQASIPDLKEIVDETRDTIADAAKLPQQDNEEKQAVNIGEVTGKKDVPQDDTRKHT